MEIEKYIRTRPKLRQMDPEKAMRMAVREFTRRQEDSRDERAETDCWEWGHARSSCRGDYGTMNGGAYAHRVAWEIANGREIPRGLRVLHSCDNPPCVNPAHLVVGTQIDNMRGAATRGRMPCGEAHHNAKLDSEKVRSVRRLRESGTTQREIASRFGVSQATVSRIIGGHIWASVKPVGANT